MKLHNANCCSFGQICEKPLGNQKLRSVEYHFLFLHLFKAMWHRSAWRLLPRHGARAFSSPCPDFMAKHVPTPKTFADLQQHFPYIMPLKVEYRDLDAMQHVNNTTYFHYFETARINQFGLPFPCSSLDLCLSTGSDSNGGRGVREGGILLLRKVAKVSWRVTNNFTANSDGECYEFKHVQRRARPREGAEMCLCATCSGCVTGMHWRSLPEPTGHIRSRPEPSGK